LVLEPVVAAALVFDEAVAVAVAPLVDPLDRAQRRVPEPVHQRAVAGPAPDLREQDEVERRRVDRSVVRAEPVLRGLARADLVDDLPGLVVDRGVVLLWREL